MSKKIRFTFDIAVGVGMFLLTGVNRGLSVSLELHDIFGILSDCFIIPGAVLIGFALLSYISCTGVFDMLTYSVYSLVKADNNDDFYNYKSHKKEKRTRYHGTLFLGSVFVSLGMIFLVLYLAV